MTYGMRQLRTPTTDIRAIEINNHFARGDRADGASQSNHIKAGLGLIEAHKIYPSPAEWAGWCGRNIQKELPDIADAMELAGGPPDLRIGQVIAKAPRPKLTKKSVDSVENAFALILSVVAEWADGDRERLIRQLKGEFNAREDKEA